ncbi:MAG TPA: class I SAM-dependent methyltransferase [Bacteroidia bacterium]|nr:class I SAM-dependent methyltransferase [Bacteroidia bacterium]
MAIQTAERISPYEASDKVIFVRSFFAYLEAAKIIRGTVLEIGSGMGYGLPELVPKSTEYITVDKYQSKLVEQYVAEGKLRFIQTTVPPLSDIGDESVDFVVCFQLIEHIRKDRILLHEIKRVLKKGGKAIITTPNRKMSLTRNPWHIREYTVSEFQKMLSGIFSSHTIYGVYGNDKVTAYYEQNKKSVQRITRFDIFRLQYILPRFLLKIPYDILNRMNRKKLLNNNTGLISEISVSDYSLKPADDYCYDIFAIAEK